MMEFGSTSTGSFFLLFPAFLSFFLQAKLANAIPTVQRTHVASEIFNANVPPSRCPKYFIRRGSIMGDLGRSLFGTVWGRDKKLIVTLSEASYWGLYGNDGSLV